MYTVTVVILCFLFDRRYSSLSRHRVSVVRITTVVSGRRGSRGSSVSLGRRYKSSLTTSLLRHTKRTCKYFPKGLCVIYFSLLRKIPRIWTVIIRGGSRVLQNYVLHCQWGKVQGQSHRVSRSSEILYSYPHVTIQDFPLESVMQSKSQRKPVFVFPSLIGYLYFLLRSSFLQF